MMDSIRWEGIAAWAMDFVRAARERPLWARLLFRLAVGRYAYREFVGLMDELERNGFSPYLDYGLEGMKLHDDPVPFDWGRERKPLALKKSLDEV